MNKSIFITGASSGIGSVLAKELASRGWNLALAARRLDKLEQLRAEIKAASPLVDVNIAELDVTNTDQVFEVTNHFFALPAGVDVVLANAGIAASQKVGSGHFDGDQRVIQTNVIGAMATIDAAMSCFRPTGKGHVVAVSSVAAFRGLPNGAAYCASKAAISTYMDAVANEAYGTDIKVTTIYPGFIDTPMNNMMKSRPFLIGAEKGAALIANAIENQVESAVVPSYPWGLFKNFIKFAPRKRLAGTANSK